MTNNVTQAVRRTLVFHNELQNAERARLLDVLEAMKDLFVRFLEHKIWDEGTVEINLRSELFLDG